MPRKLRIALAIELAPRKKGSIEDWIGAFALAASKRGHRLTLFCHDPIHAELEAGLRQASVEIRSLAELTRRPVKGALLLSRCFDVIHLNLFAPRDLIPVIAYAGWPCRVVFVDHLSGHGDDGGWARKQARRALDALVLARIRDYVGVSRYVSDRAVARFRTSRVHHVIYNGIDEGRFRPSPKVESPGGARIVCVANLIQHKGVDVLIRAIARLATRDTVLEIVGDGPLLGELRDLSLELGIGSRVRFLGLRDDVPARLAEADLVVHPSVWEEAFGLSVVEAMAQELPVVASRVGAIPELLVDGESGVLVPAGDAEALASAIGALLDAPERCLAIGKAARQRVLQRFRLDASVCAHLDSCEAAGAPP